MATDRPLRDELFAMWAQIERNPPAPRLIYAHHSVPYGRVFSQWMTDGTLVWWVNRGEIADLPHGREESAARALWGVQLPTGITVVYV